MNLRTALARLRLIGFIEGISALLLFCVAMPWKYLIDLQSGTPVVTAIGTAHGILWTVYIVAVLNAWIVQKWGIGRVLIAGLASIPPFATFIFDLSLQQEQSRKPVNLNPRD